MSPLVETFGNASKRGWSVVSLGGGTQWIAVMGETNPINNAIAIDSSSNVYATGTYSGPFNYINRATTAKFNSNGAIQWQKSITSGSNYTYGGSLAIDGSNNVYLGMGVYASYHYWNLIKYNSSGIIQSQYRISNNGNFYGGNNTLSLNSANSLAVYGSDGSIVSFNTSGSINAFKTLNFFTDGGISKTYQAADGSVYVCGGRGYFDGNDNFQIGGYVQKLPSDLSSTTWGLFSLNSESSAVNGMASDSAGNIYLARPVNGVWTTYKFDSSGSIIWQRIFTGTTGPNTPTSIAVDSDGNVYVAGNTWVSGGGTNPTIVKYNSSGTQLFARTLSVYTGSNTDETANDIKVDGNGNMYVVGRFSRLVSGFQQGVSFVAKLPTDGSKTGTYTVGGLSVTYATFGYSSSNGGDTFALGAGSISNVSGSVITPSYTNSDSSFSTSTTTI